MDYDIIPRGLRAHDQWICWRYEERDGKQTKMPVNPRTEGRAKVSNPDTWTDFETAVEYDTLHDTKGLGFVFTDDDMLVGIDLDDVRSKYGIEEWARDVLEKLDSFGEWSVSGTGAHIYVLGIKPGERCKTAVGDAEFEMYDSDRFFAMTGDHIDGTPSTIEERNDEVTELYEEYLANDGAEDADVADGTPRGSTVDGNSLSDDEVIQKVKSADNGDYFTDLWEGNWGQHSHKWENDSHSEADQALCSMLAFWTGCDRDQMDRLFRRSGLMRDKWDRDDYRERTLDKAIADTDEVYSPGGWSRVQWMYGNSDIPQRRARDAAYQVLRDECTFATIRETDELLWYNDGVYEEHGESVVREKLEANLGEHFSTYEVNQITERIKSATYHTVDEFGADTSDPHICLENGVLDLNDFLFRDHSPNDLFLTKLPVEYNPSASCPEFDSFLDDVLLNSEDKALIYEMLGYCLWPGYDIANKFLIMYGDGANGKSTLLHVMREFLGDATTNWDLQDLVDNRFATADLHHAMANIAGDLPSTKLTQTGTIKKLTGGDTVMAEKKHKPSFSFENRAKLIFAANQPPVIDDPSHAIARRLMLIEMPYTFTREDDDNPDAEPAHKLRERLTTDEELSGILNEALDGLQRIKESGFSQRLTPEDLRTHYKRISDPVARFAQDCLTNDTIDSIKKCDVLEAYNNWADETGAPTKDTRVFHRALQQNADVSTRQARKSNGKSRERVYEGLTFTDEGWEYAPTNMTFEEEYQRKSDLKSADELTK